MLTCGCVMSEKLFLQNLPALQGVCPICGTRTEILAPILALRNLFKKITEKKNELGLSILSGAIPAAPSSSLFNLPAVDAANADALSTSNVDIDDLSSQFAASLSPSKSSHRPSVPELDFPSSNSNKMTLAEIFQSAARIVAMQESTGAGNNILVKVDSRTNSGIIDTSNPSFISTGSDEYSTTTTTTREYDVLKYSNVNMSLATFEQREVYYKRCFPNYRKQYQHNINSRFLYRTKNYISTSISPDTSKFAVTDEDKWAVFWIPDDSNDSPTLLCSGRSKGESAQQEKSKEKDKNKNKSTSTLPSSAHPEIPPLMSPEMEQVALADWSHQIVSLSNRYLAVAGTNGILRVYDMENEGRCVYHHKSKFNIRCMTMSPNGSLIACAITGIDTKTNTEQPMIVLHWLQLGDTAPLWTQYTNSLSSMDQIQGLTLQLVETVTITIPYHDVINCLSFSPDESFLSCGTNVTRHILVINITNPHEPRMILKTSRLVDNATTSEGITSVEFFPSNRLITISSVAANGYPVVIDTKINKSSSSSHGAATLGRLSMLFRVEKVGANIHKSCISPRGNAVAFLDKNGLIYLLHAPLLEGGGPSSSAGPGGAGGAGASGAGGSGSSSTGGGGGGSGTGPSSSAKRVYVIAEASSAPQYREAASMRFSPTGHQLYIVDRKGCVYIEDFAAGNPQQAGISKCRYLS